MPQEPLEQKPSWANASTEIAGWESPWSVSGSPSSGGAENSEEATAAGASFQRAVRRKFLVGAVGIEFAVHLISPADSIALVSSLPPKMQLVGRVLWPRCGLLPRPREKSATRHCR